MGGSGALLLKSSCSYVVLYYIYEVCTILMKFLYYTIRPYLNCRDRIELKQIIICTANINRGIFFQ